ncbi:uncharacterized protein [Physcomitrium patens]|uniref:uncharacterized protein isoform X6 n=1 Tax=Physcomitrium patens TaxID=3218 RepID=UPI000D166F48|nr:uncharacterized protein LOC112272637 isoform X2 [Physcomitrium patens]|eukprot:XP_024356366.1 uncharacterized protein LOC112272637 isoform X2 [Physcomitrella patens]
MAMMIKVFEASSDHSQQLLRKLLGSFEILGWRIWVDAGVEGLGTRGLLEHFQGGRPGTLPLGILFASVGLDCSWGLSNIGSATFLVLFFQSY